MKYDTIKSENKYNNICNSKLNYNSPKYYINIILIERTIHTYVPQAVDRFPQRALLTILREGIYVRARH